LSRFFAHSRTALWYGLKQISLKKGDSILLPDFICDVVLHPLQDLGIKPVYYPINDALETDWDVLEDVHQNKPASALFLVHYFGQPQDLSKAQYFCRKHNIILIEDNAHGHGGTFKGEPLGSFGEMGISSPRKQLHTPSGGVLYLHGKLHPPPRELPSYPVNRFRRSLGKAILRSPVLKGNLRRLLKTEPDFEDPCGFSEIREPYFQADSVSVNCIRNENWHVHAKRRREAWSAWYNYATELGFEPLYKKPHPESSPWALPVYVSEPAIRNWLLLEGWRNGEDFFSWPTLPFNVIQKTPEVLKRWSNLICFPLNKLPDLNSKSITKLSTYRNQ